MISLVVDFRSMHSLIQYSSKMIQLMQWLKTGSKRREVSCQLIASSLPGPMTLSQCSSLILLSQFLTSLDLLFKLLDGDLLYYLLFHHWSHLQCSSSLDFYFSFIYFAEIVVCKSLFQLLENVFILTALMSVTWLDGILHDSSEKVTSRDIPKNEHFIESTSLLEQSLSKTFVVICFVITGYCQKACFTCQIEAISNIQKNFTSIVTKSSPIFAFHCRAYE